MRHAFLVPLVTAVALSLTAPVVFAGPGDRQSDGLPYQYIYLADFAKLRHEAEKGNPEALFQLGVMHYDPPESSGVSQSYRRAFVLFYEAALRGHGTAQHNVGAMYWNGDYVAQNPVEGYAWFKIAALAGDAAGVRKVKRHAVDLSEAQLKAVTERLPVLQAILAKAKAKRSYDPRDYGIR